MNSDLYSEFLVLLQRCFREDANEMGRSAWFSPWGSFILSSPPPVCSRRCSLWDINWDVSRDSEMWWLSFRVTVRDRLLSNCVPAAGHYLSDMLKREERKHESNPVSLGLIPLPCPRLSFLQIKAQILTTPSAPPDGCQGPSPRLFSALHPKPVFTQDSLLTFPTAQNALSSPHLVEVASCPGACQERDDFPGDML